MSKICYDARWKPKTAAVDTIRMAARICARYPRDGYDLTLRQLYRQFRRHRELLSPAASRWYKVVAVFERAV